MREEGKEERGKREEGRGKREEDVPCPKSISYKTEYFPNQKRSKRKIFDPTWEIIPLRPINKGKRLEIRIK